jgi:hypothetical protein
MARQRPRSPRVASSPARSVGGPAVGSAAFSRGGRPVMFACVSNRHAKAVLYDAGSPGTAHDAIQPSWRMSPHRMSALPLVVDIRRGRVLDGAPGRPRSRVVPRAGRVVSLNPRRASIARTSADSRAERRWATRAPTARRASLRRAVSRRARRRGARLSRCARRRGARLSRCARCRGARLEKKSRAARKFFRARAAPTIDVAVARTMRVSSTRAETSRARKHGKNRQKTRRSAIVNERNRSQI